MRCRRSSRRGSTSRTGPGRAEWGVDFDPYAPYGALVDTTVRVVTWNVWGRYGDWEGREAGIEKVLAAAAPDLVGLTESGAAADGTQADRVARSIGSDHALFVGGMDNEGWESGTGLVSRWPIARHEARPLDADGALGSAVFALVEGPRGP